MIYPSSRSLLLILFKSNKTNETIIPSIFSTLGTVHNFKSSTSSNTPGWTNSLISQVNHPGWTDALIIQVNDQEKLLHLDTKMINDTVEKEYQGENILISPIIHSTECIKDTSNDLENDIFFVIAFRLEDRIDQFPEDWLKATPYMSSCDGYKRATLYKAISDHSPYPYFNLSVWSSLDSWKQALSTEESKKAHTHQSHVQRTPFIGKYFQSSSNN